MHTAPPLMVNVGCAVMWRASMWLLIMLVCATMTSWWLTQPTPVPPWASATSAGGSLLALLLGRLHLCLGSLTLRWDGQSWHLGEAEVVEPVPGEVVVANDLGSLMLLRFVPNAVPRWRSATWIVVQRRGLETRWHALRCALYSPRPSNPGNPGPRIRAGL